ncbi:MAG: T9SS type A sorting domain-containing protein [Bacteroidia bacterium]|nr:T9SS type A sorting domain-containing protein [Bacteroidia bacterium]
MQDAPVCIEQLPDSGYLVLCASWSAAGFDKSENNRDSTGLTSDFWLLRLDASGNKVWDKTYGGNGSDRPAALLLTPGGNFVLAGTSASGISGEKSDSLRGVSDFWVLLVDSSGQKLWDKTIGGVQADELTGMILTSDNYLMLSGWTLSGPGADKTSPTYGDFDFWWVKLDLSSNFLLEMTHGGMLGDNCFSICATNDGGALMSGYSNSPVSFSKSQPSQGVYDYWILRIDSLGRKIWDKTYGGLADDYAFSAIEFPGVTRGFLVGGFSFSGVSGHKTEPSRGADDYWLLRLDVNGNLIWDKSYGGTDFDELSRIGLSSSGHVVLSGTSYSSISGEKSENNLGPEQSWLVVSDTANGQMLFDKTFFSAGHDENAQVIPTMDGCFTSVNFTVSDTGGYRTHFNNGGGDVWLSKICLLTALESTVTNESTWMAVPNPANRQLLLKCGTKAEWNLLVFNPGGACLFKDSFSGSEYNLDVSGFSNGLYFLRLFNEESWSNNRFVKVSY